MSIHVLRRLVVLALAASVPGSLARAQRASHVHTIDAGGAVEGTLKEGPQCRALAPSDWRVTGGRQQGDLLELASADGRIYAGWGIRGVDRRMEGYYGPLYGDPATSSLALASATLQALGSGGPARYSAAPQSLGSGFVAQTFESATHKGLVVYRVYPAPPGLGAGSYIISLRIATADRRTWDTGGQRVAVGVAASIACTTMLDASRTRNIDLPRPGDPPSMRNRKSGETNELADYNVQLGTQWVHSESTGQSYMVDAASAWNENGPDGPGYYRKSGNSYEKLTPGFR
jgi:hypothetical protein